MSKRHKILLIRASLFSSAEKTESAQNQTFRVAASLQIKSM